MTRALALGLLVGLATIACDKTTPQTLAGPSLATTPVMAVIVTAATEPAPLRLYAQARLSDGATQDVTSTAVWESLNPSIASVWQGGMVTAYSAGDVTFRATYQSVSGILQASVAPGAIVKRHALGGVISSIEKPYHVVADARVVVVDGPNAGRFVVADVDGLFSLTGLVPGAMSLQISQPGYELWHSKDFLLDSDMTIAPQLVPAANAPR